MEKTFKLRPPIMPNFITYEVPERSKQDGFNPDANKIPITDLSREEAEAYGELMKQAFLEHWESQKTKRKLEWWEDRDVKDMPEYVKAVRTFRGSQGGFYENMSIHKVIRWDVNLPYTTDREWIRVDYTIPATLEEYTHYTKSKGGMR
jgi:hypothetical protein